MNETRSNAAARPPAAWHGPRSSGFGKLMWGLMSGVLVGSLLWAAGTAARATEAGADKPRPEADPPGRVGRIADVQGNVSLYDREENRWSDAERNLPLTTGDRLSTAGDARVELRVGSTVLRLGGGTELEAVRLDDERLTFRLHSGSVALRVRNREKAAEIDIVTQEARLLPLRAGHYRIDRHDDDTTFAASWRGDLRVEGGKRLTVAPGQRVELYRGREGDLRHIWRGVRNDTFGSWAQAEDDRDERHSRTEHVSPEMTGAEDLDRWGQWDRHPEYGAIWYPSSVAVGWAPYRYGRWVWVRPWGWTWVDDARWGFAPFHYGRWVYWRDRWCWAPGSYVARPVYAPAMVAWVGGPHFSVSVNVGGPTVGWVPLAPREVYVPHYRATPVYIDRVNVNPRFVTPGQPHGQPGQPGHHPQTIPTGPVAYTNQGVPGAVTVVPRDVLVRREPVARAVVSLPAEVQRAPVTAVAPPAPVVATPPGAAGAPTAPPRVEPPPHRVQTAPRVGSPAGDDGRVRDRRDLREGREVRPGREPREPRGATGRRDNGAAGARQVAPAPGVQAVPPTSAAPSAQPAPTVAAPQAPRVISLPSHGGATQPPPAAAVPPPRPVAPPTPPAQAAPTVQPPAQRVQPASPPQRAQPAASPPAQRGGSDDDRKRTGQAPRHGEREREASR
ncbi:MAG: hypothetical protein JNL30_04970 [Rubrivivax sp.]|nr:hypothetical protein [Rubrivivax sp.]